MLWVIAFHLYGSIDLSVIIGYKFYVDKYCSRLTHEQQCQIVSEHSETEMNLHFIKQFGSYLTENTVLLPLERTSAVSGHNGCLV